MCSTDRVNGDVSTVRVTVHTPTQALTVCWTCVTEDLIISIDRAVHHLVTHLPWRDALVGLGAVHQITTAKTVTAVLIITNWAVNVAITDPPDGNAV